MTQKQEDLLELNNNEKPKYLSNRTRKEFCISSICPDGNHVLFFDFDNFKEDSLHFIQRSLSQIQHRHKLGDIYIIKSRNGFNAICLDKFWLNEAYNILFYTRWNDFNHIIIGFLGESWCLRLSPEKKMFQRIIPTEEYDHRIQSKAHFDFFTKYFDFKGLRIIAPDEGGDVQLESYIQNRI